MHHKSRNDSASILRFYECVTILSRVEFSFEQQVALHASGTAVLCLFPNPYTLEPKTIMHNMCKNCVHSTLLSSHKRILSRGEINLSALLHQHLSVQLKTRLERHLLLKSKLRLDSRENHDNLRFDPSQPYYLNQHN